MTEAAKCALVGYCSSSTFGDVNSRVIDDKAASKCFSRMLLPLSEYCCVPSAESPNHIHRNGRSEGMYLSPEGQTDSF